MSNLSKEKRELKDVLNVISGGFLNLPNIDKLFKYLNKESKKYDNEERRRIKNA